MRIEPNTQYVLQSARRPKVKVHKHQPFELTPLSLTLTPLSGRDVWEFLSECWFTPVLSQECQTEWSGQPGCSSAAWHRRMSFSWCWVPGQHGFASKRPESMFQHAGASTAVSRILFRTPNTTLLVDGHKCSYDYSLSRIYLLKCSFLFGLHPKKTP